ncbi:MAG: hypothetical protein KME13_11430 [Myxacorys californica WJT36-NPBG1]|jgi:hypothetical protein|nr:hypothetical protein [Myxacorys californica WJT36-NPBG1]
MSNIFSNRIVCLWEEGKERPEILADIERYFGAQHCGLAEQILDKLEEKFTQYQEQEMSKSLGYFGANYENPAIAQFAQQFEQGNNDCSLSHVDQAAVCAVLSCYGFDAQSGQNAGFWQCVESALGDYGEEGSELHQAINALSAIKPDDVWAVISWLVQ